MPNHVHLISVTQSEDGLRKAVGEAHRRYTRHINSRNGWKGHLWQGRFASYPMDEHYLVATAHYIVMNPVRAGIVKRPEQYRWSSCKAHLQGEDDILVKVNPLAELIPNWEELLQEELTPDKYQAIRNHEKTGRPLGNDDFVERLEKQTSRLLKKQKPGPKKR